MNSILIVNLNFKIMQKYQPISCSFYDFLEAAAARNKEVEVEYYNEDKEVVTITTKVKDLYAKNGEEFIILENGAKFRLDNLVAFDGQVLAEFGGACAI